MSALIRRETSCSLGERVLGPLRRLSLGYSTLHIKKIVLKIEISAGSLRFVRYWRVFILRCKDMYRLSSLLVHYDVDPA